MELTEAQRAEINWISDKPIVGMALIIKGGSVDSFGNKIIPSLFYEVGKHKTNKRTVILPTNESKQELKADIVNAILKKKGELN